MKSLGRAFFLIICVVSLSTLCLGTIAEGSSNKGGGQAPDKEGQKNLINQFGDLSSSDTLPEGVMREGAMIDDNYAIGVFHIDKTRLVGFKKLLSRDSRGIPSFKILDVIEITDLSGKEELSFGTCKVNGIYDQEVLAITDINDTANWTDVRKAWRANRRTHRIEEIPAVSVSCENIGYGE